MTELRIALIGMGKMGRAIDALAPERGCTVVARIDESGDARHVTRESLAGAQVAIEFTAPDAAVENIRACIAADTPVVVGTTGWSIHRDVIEQEVEKAGAAILTAANFSLGVALFDQIIATTSRLAATLPGFEAHMIETHHSAKKDAPSGTAAQLALTYGEASGRDIRITSVRVGSVPGTHELVLDGPFEQIRLIHEARDRRVFAEGALAAARWLVGKRGVFTMKDLIASPETHAT